MGDYAVQVPSHFFGRNAHCLDALFTSPSVAPFVAKRIIAKIMCQAIDFDRNTGGLAEEVENEWPKRMLSAELQSIWAQPKHSPQPDL